MIALTLLFLVAAVRVQSSWALWPLQRRAAQTTAVCQASFSWAQNSQGFSPCQLTANVDALCNGGNWNINALDASINYANPGPNTSSGPTNNLCTCSWLSYNLLGACTACQGFPEKISIWDDYISNCVGLLSDTFFPANISLPANQGMPWWAVTNPTQWTNHRFDPIAAQAIQSSGHPDVSSVPLSSGGSKSPVGAIAGGVIGGVLVILGGAFVAWFILRRKRREMQLLASEPSSHKHLRLPSDMSDMRSMAGYPTQTSATPFAPTLPSSATIRTHGHNSSVNSLPFFSSAAGSSPPYGITTPPIPAAREASPVPVNRENVIEPFTAMQQANDSHIDRKYANGVLPALEPPGGPSSNRVRMDVTPSSPPAARTRFNPPTYIESTSPSQSGSGSPGSSTPRRHAKQGSADTNDATSIGSGLTRLGPGAPSTSIATTGDLITPTTVMHHSRFPSDSSPASSGRDLTTSSRGRRRPTEDEGTSGIDIA